MEMKYRDYKVNNSTIRIIFGNILDSKSEVIVSSDDSYLSMGGGVSRAILSGGGDAVASDARKLVPVKLGDVVVTSAGNLQFQKYIFHCVTIDLDSPHHPDQSVYKYIIQHSVNKSISLAHSLQVESIAFPSIGAGVARIPINMVLEIMADEVFTALTQTNRSMLVELYLYDRYGRYSEFDYMPLFEKLAVNIAKYEQTRHSELAEMAAGSLSSETRNVAMPATPSATVLPSDPAAVALPARSKHSVFISYSRIDMDAAESIIKVLEKSGVDYWIDKEGIYSGENFKEVIVDAIDDSKALIFISSANSNSSVYCIHEVEYAIRQGKTVIPVTADDAPYAKSLRLDLMNTDCMPVDAISRDDKKFVASVKYALGV